jgi:O-methyltransferase involved in polyketide biosynthesis
MIESIPSRTALVTSLMRALHSRRDPLPLLDDPWGDRLVPKYVRDGMIQRILARMDSNARDRALRAPNSILDDFLLANAAIPALSSAPAMPRMRCGRRWTGACASTS